MEQEMTLYCECGAALEPGVNVCPRCGAEYEPAPVYSEQDVRDAYAARWADILASQEETTPEAVIRANAEQIYDDDNNADADATAQALKAALDQYSRGAKILTNAHLVCGPRRNLGTAADIQADSPVITVSVGYTGTAEMVKDCGLRATKRVIAQWSDENGPLFELIRHGRTYYAVKIIPAWEPNAGTRHYTEMTEDQALAWDPDPAGELEYTELQP